MRKYLILLLMICYIAVLLVPATSVASASELERYGYTQLKNDNQRTAYKAILAGVGEVRSEISFNINDKSSNIIDDVKLANEMVTKDYPELFWYNTAINISTDGSTVTVKPKEYTVAGKKINSLGELKPYKNQLDQAVNKALAKIKGNYSDYEIAHTFHDYMVQNVDYKAQGDHQTAYGSLVGGVAVCAGYARGYQLLLNRAGIRSFYVDGESIAPSGQKIGHAWNLVWLDGDCYYSDTTWDDQSNELFHEYLNLSKEEISKTHFTEDPLPPSCGHDEYTFFVKNDKSSGVCDFHGHKTIEEVAGCFQLKSNTEGVATYYCTIHYHGEDFNLWFEHVKNDLVKALNLTGAVKLKIIELGLEHHITVTGELKSDLPPAATSPQVPPPETAPAGQQRPNPGSQIEYPTEAPTQAPKPVIPDVQKPTQPAIIDSTDGTETVTDPTNSETGTSANTPTEPDSSESQPQNQDGDDILMYIVYGAVLVCLAAGGFLLYKKLTPN